MQVNLSTTTQSLELLTSIAGNIHWHVGYADIPYAITGATSSLDGEGIITTAASTTILAAPAASITRRIQHLHIFNNGVTNTITIRKDVGGTKYIYISVSISNGESIRIVNDKLAVYDTNGREKLQSADNTIILGETKSIFKVGSLQEAAGSFYSFGKDTGFPGAWSVGTPGINGRNTDGGTATDAGSVNAGPLVTGSWFLRDLNGFCNSPGQFIISDVLWINSGLAVTTTTAQAITQPTLPARDNNGTTLGEGVQAGLLVTTATTNAAAISTIIMSYTNSDGVAGRTATVASFPLTAVIGTVVKFQLATGDKGIRSIQSITLGTSLVGGAVSVFCFEELASVTIPGTNSGSFPINKILDVKLWPGHCLIPMWLAGNATAPTINANLFFVNK